jgi:hypothetical protein
VLRLVEQIGDDDDDDDLYDRVSGVFFVGCLHDERSDNFRNRVSWTILTELEYIWRDGASAFRWIPFVESTVLITAKFRELNLPFPVWTYYEGVSTIYKREHKLFKGTRDYSEIVSKSTVSLPRCKKTDIRGPALPVRSCGSESFAFQNKNLAVKPSSSLLDHCLQGHISPGVLGRPTYNS